MVYAGKVVLMDVVAPMVAEPIALVVVEMDVGDGLLVAPPAPPPDARIISDGEFATAAQAEDQLESDDEADEQDQTPPADPDAMVDPSATPPVPRRRTRDLVYSFSDSPPDPNAQVGKQGRVAPKVEAPIPTLVDGVYQVHHSLLHVIKLVRPKYPAANWNQGFFNPVCRAVVDIDITGRPSDIKVTGCPLVFESSTKRGVGQWRWRPYQVDGTPVPSRTTIDVRFMSDAPEALID